MVSDEELFAKFLGLYLMKHTIPDDLYKHVMTHDCPSQEPDIRHIYDIIKGSPDENSLLVRQLVIDTLNPNSHTNFKEII